MDYLNNLLVGYSNKLKTTGIILGSLCVGIIGIVSAAFISYNLIHTTSSTEYVTIPLRTLSIISSTPNVTFSHISYDSLSKNDIIQIVNATNSSDQYILRRLSFNATVPINSSIFVDIYLPLEVCSNLTIYKYYNRTFQPNKAINVNSTTCSFSINVTSDELEDDTNGTIIANDRRRNSPNPRMNTGISYRYVNYMMYTKMGAHPAINDDLDTMFRLKSGVDDGSLSLGTRGEYAAGRSEQENEYILTHIGVHFVIGKNGQYTARNRFISSVPIRHPTGTTVHCTC